MEHFSCSSMWIPHHRTVLLRLVVFKGSRIGSISFLLSLNRRASGCTCLLLFESWSHVCLSPWSTRSPLIFTAVSVCSLSCSCVVVLWLRPATVLLHSADSLMCVCVCVRVILCLSVFACGLGPWPWAPVGHLALYLLFSGVCVCVCVCVCVAGSGLRIR